MLFRSEKSSEDTILTKKTSTKISGISTPTGSYDEPASPYGAKYPFNKVYETESGHIQEFDDTPGQERINTYHRSGTFTEVDANGTQVNYIVGDNFVLMEQNGCIHVAGECNITVDGQTNIYARSDANVKVEQNATITVGNNLDIGAANDVTLAAGGDLMAEVGGKFAIDAGEITMKSQGAMSVHAVGDYSAKGANMALQSEGNAEINVAGTLNMAYDEGNLGMSAGEAVFMSPTLLAIIALRPGYFPTYILIPTITTLLLAFLRMSIVLRHARNLGEEKILARTDELTGLPNRRRLIAELDTFSKIEGALLLLDLNGFKAVNDRYGHGVGDRILKQVAHRFSRALPTGAILSRLGGDEFGVLI